MPLELGRMIGNRQSFQLVGSLGLGLLQILQSGLPFILRHQTSARWVLRHFLIYGLLLQFFLFLVLELVDVVWNLAVVFVLASNDVIIGSCGALARRRLHLENSLVHIGLDKVLLLTLLQLIDLVGLWHHILGWGQLGTWTTCSHLLSAALGGEDLTTGILRGSVLNRVGPFKATSYASVNLWFPGAGLGSRRRHRCLILAILDHDGLWLLEIVDALNWGGGSLGGRATSRVDSLRRGARRQGLSSVRVTCSHRRSLLGSADPPISIIHLDVFHLDLR